MYPNFINIFGTQLTYYGLMVSLSFAVLWLNTVSRGRKLGYPEDFIQNILTLIVISAAVSARLLHVIVYWESYAARPQDIIFSRVGFIFLGGFIGAVVSSAWYTRKNERSLLGVADLFAPYLALAHGIGRIGCFLFGCCYGSICHLPWAVRFPVNSPAYIDHFNRGLLSFSAEWSLPVHPTQLYSSLFNFVTFALLILIRKRQSFRGQLAMIYLIVYSVGRFLIEFARGDDRGFVGSLSTSQFVCLLLFFLALAGYLALRRYAFPPEIPIEPGEELSE